MNKIKKWLIGLFKDKKPQLNSGNINTLEKDIIRSEDKLKKEFKDYLRTDSSKEENLLISKFENGEITFLELTDEIRNKIISGYSLTIEKNLNIIQNNIEKIKRLETSSN